jgi:hypothetical protein
LLFRSSLSGFGRGRVALHFIYKPSFRKRKKLMIPSN